MVHGMTARGLVARALLGALILLTASLPLRALAQAAPAASAAAVAPAASAASEPASAPAVAPAASAGASAADSAASSVSFVPVVPAEPTPTVRVNPPWLDDPLSGDGWRYSAALDALGASGQADALRRVLWRRWLSQLEGVVPKAGLSVRQALADGESLRATEEDAELRGRWSTLVNQQMQASLPKAAQPIPPELEADAPRLREAAPGLWSLHAPDGTLRSRAWWLLLRHQAPLAMPLADFRVRAPSGAAAMVFDCSLPRYAEMALALPGRDTAYLCRANAGSGTPAAWDDLARRLRSSATLPLQIEPVDLSGGTAVQRVAMRLEAPYKAATDALVAAANASARSTGTQAQAGARAASAAVPSAAVRSWADRLRVGGIVLVAVVVFSLIASLAGIRAAMLISLLLLTGLTLASLFKALPGLSVLTQLLPRVDPATPGAALSPLRIAAALGLPLLATLALALCHELLFGERIGILRGLAGRLADLLADGVVDRIFGSRRY